MFKFASLDTETTGLDPDTCQLIEIGGVVADMDGRIHDRFHCYIDHDLYEGEPYALGMHGVIFHRIAAEKRKPVAKREWLILRPDQAVNELRTWLHKNFGETKITIAGKNFGGFDKAFFKRLGFFDAQQPRLKMAHKYLDPGVLYFNPETDQDLPNLDECLSRAGIQKSVTHQALDDAIDVVNIVAHYYKNHNPFVKKSRRVGR